MAFRRARRRRFRPVRTARRGFSRRVRRGYTMSRGGYRL